MFPRTGERPSLSLNGSLPHLVAHINEPKVKAFVSLFRHLNLDSASPAEEVTSSSAAFYSSAAASTSSAGQEEENAAAASAAGSDGRGAWNGVDRRWILVQFNVEQLSVEVQSRGRSVAELQVRTQKRPQSIETRLNLKKNDSNLLKTHEK